MIWLEPPHYFGVIFLIWCCDNFDQSNADSNDKSTDELLNERAKNKMLSEEMEATLHDIQNM